MSTSRATIEKQIDRRELMKSIGVEVVRIDNMETYEELQTKLDAVEAESIALHGE